MVLPPKSSHPLGEKTSAVEELLPEAVDVVTYAGKSHIEWVPDAAVTPIGRLPFFIQFQCKS